MMNPNRGRLTPPENAVSNIWQNPSKSIIFSLTWGDAGNSTDFRNASRGQWFLGVLDVVNLNVYLIPSDVEPLDVFIKNKENKKKNGETYISKPSPDTSPHNNSLSYPIWHSRPMIGKHYQGVNSPSGGQGALRQHGRVVRLYECDPDNCLGFAVIKMTNSMGEYRDRSQSLNGTIHKTDPKTMRMSPSGRSTRMPERWSDILKNWLTMALGCRLQDSCMP